jgi:hypothetical protein
MRRLLILMAMLVISFNFCLSVANAMSATRGGEKIAGSVVTGGLDGWAASAMLTVGWVHTAGAVYGGLTIFVLLLNLSGGVSDLVELRADSLAGGTAMKPSGENGLIESSSQKAGCKTRRAVW